MKNAFRQLIKSPGFTIVSLITLALGIGINTNAFSFLNRTLLQSLPFRDPSRILMVWGATPKAQEMQQSPGDYIDERDQSTVFDGLAAYYINSSSSVVDQGKVAERATVLQCTANFFRVMGIAPALGRDFTDEEQARQEPVALLSHAYWEKNFAGDPHVLGHTLRLNGASVTIVGVTPPELDDPEIWGRFDIMHLDPVEVNRGYREGTWYNVVGRLKPGVTRAQAQAEMDSIANKLARDFPKTNAERKLRVAQFPTDSEGDIGRHIIWTVMDLAAAVLLIACVNLANLQLVRSTARSREIAIRLALGSSRMRIMGMLLGESLLLSLCGGALGLLVAKWANDYVGAYFNLPMPLNYRVLAFAFAASAATGALFGTLPAWMASHADVGAALKQGGRGTSAGGSRNRLRQALIVGQLAVALVLLTGAGYFIRGIQRIMHHEMGWSPEHLVIGFIELPNAKYGEHGDKRCLAFGQKLISGLRQVPGVEDAAISVNTPVGSVFASESFVIGGRPAPAKGAEPQAWTNRVTQGYFAAYGMHILRGRDFTDADKSGAPSVAIVNKALAEKFWPGEDPIGKRLGGADPKNPEWCEVVGIVNDVVGSIRIARYESPYQIYRPWLQDTFRFLIFSMRTAADPHAVVEGARKALANVEPDVAATVLAPAPDMMESNMSGLNLIRKMLGVMALLGLLLSVIGIYGVVANLASERTQEIGVRMALGAGPADVQWLFMRGGIILALLGSAIGLLASLGLVAALDKLLEAIPGNDPWVIAAVAVFLAATALVACWIPAWRATKVDPTVSLRAE